MTSKEQARNCLWRAERVRLLVAQLGWHDHTARLGLVDEHLEAIQAHIEHPPVSFCTASAILWSQVSQRLRSLRGYVPDHLRARVEFAADTALARIEFERGADL